MNTLQLSKPCIPNNNRVNKRHSGSRAFRPIGKYLHSLSLPLRLAPPNVNTFLALRKYMNTGSTLITRTRILANFTFIRRF